MTGTIVQLRRDPFARTTLERTTMEDRGRGCAWCGQHRASGRLFHYRVGSDAIRPTGVWGRGFCDLSCYVAFEE